MHKLSGVSSLMLITEKLSSPSSLSKFLPSYLPLSAHPPLNRMWLSWLHTQASINQCKARIWIGPCQMQPTFFCAPGWYYEELSDLIQIPRIAMYTVQVTFLFSLFSWQDCFALHFVPFPFVSTQWQSSLLHLSIVRLTTVKPNIYKKKLQVRLYFDNQKLAKYLPSPTYIQPKSTCAESPAAGVLAFDVKITLEEAFLTNNPST